MKNLAKNFLTRDFLTRGFLTRDFLWSWRGVTVRDTGTFIAFNPALLKDIWRGGIYVLAERLRSSLSRPPLSRPRFRVLTQPGPIRPWYLAWAMVRRAGGKFTRGDNHELSIYFKDLTVESKAPSIPSGPSLNYQCLDISKSKVAEIFKEVFGYGYDLDPLTHHGLMVEKTEENGRHDGRIVKGPCAPRPGYVYQKVIDNRVIDNGSQSGAQTGETVADIRCPTLGGEIMLIFIKQRPTGQRFDNYNNACRIARIEEHLSRDERGLIKRFCAAMKLDYGGLDILRDNADGRIYIVDVNKTDMGPPLALPLKGKLKAASLMGAALQNYIKTYQDRSNS